MMELKLKIYYSLIVSLLFYGGQCLPLNKETSDDVLVTIDQGTLKGFVAKDYFGQPYYRFQSIPYAEPPVGQLRLQNPKPAKSWSGILDATVPNNICVQWLENVLVGSEDCLYLHVYTKNLPQNGTENLKPVMVWIHGGGLINGAIDEYGPEFLITEDIVLVSIQYRLGLLGFLSIDKPEANVPGNFGFKDQVLALKWVQKNIEKFGGNPNQVTIFGESAGGTSVHLHMLSAQSEGLFHGAISQSSATDLEVQRDSKYNKYVELLNCQNNDIRKVVQCLQERPTEKVMEAQNQMVTFEQLENGVIGYTIEPKGPEAFLTEPIKEIIKKGTFNQVPFIAGFTTDDGVLGLFIDQRVAPNFTDPEMLIPINALSELPKGSPESIKWGNKIKAFYWGSTEPSYKNMDPLINYETDNLFLYPIYKHAGRMAKISKASTYFYQFNYHTTLNPNIIDYPRPLVQHGDDNNYLFVNNKTPSHMDPKSDEFIGVHRMVKIWTTFAKTGNPNPTETDPLIDVRWKPITSEVFNYLEISPNMSSKINPSFERMQFWKTFYDECCNDGFPESDFSTNFNVKFVTNVE